MVLNLVFAVLFISTKSQDQRQYSGFFFFLTLDPKSNPVNSEITVLFEDLF